MWFGILIFFSLNTFGYCASAPSSFPTRVPTYSPTLAPSKQPTFVPSVRPSKKPTYLPTRKPTSSPSSSAPTIRAKQMSAAVSEVVSTITMGSYDGFTDSKIDCPYFQSGLIDFNILFPSVFSGDDITIPSNTTVLISKNSSINTNIVVNRILVQPGGSLVFNDEDLTINAREIYVSKGGSLSMGSENCRIQSNVDVTFYGNASDSVLTDSMTGTGGTSKGLISSGTVDMHGKQYFPTWTRLSQSVGKGDTRVFLQDRVNWEVGQEILLTTTVYHDCPDEWVSWCSNQAHQNEVRIITGSYMDDASETYWVSISQGLSFAHYGGYEYQGEVALLSRNINLRGSNSGDNFGGHVKVRGPSSIGRFSGVRGDNMGQLNVMARYPFHFHLMGDNRNSSSSFFQDCSVTNSNFRCFVVHGTNHTRVSRNVAYKAKGMCYYLEDGVEENNLLEFNLAAHISPIYRPADGGNDQLGEIFYQSAGLLVPADTSAAGFYISNAMNTFVGNAASGGWTGYAFPNIPAPLGNYKGTLPSNSNYNPQDRPLLKFYGNTAHSAGNYWQGHGTCLYVGASLYYNRTTGLLNYNSGRNSRDTVFGNGTVTFFLFQNTKLFLCKQGIEHWGNNVRIDRAEFHDVALSAQLFGDIAIHNTLINLRSRNPFGGFLPTMQRIGFQFYGITVQTILSNVTFRNISTRGKYGDCAIRYTDFSDKYLAQGINSVVNIRFDNVIDSARICIDDCGPACGTKKATISSKVVSVWDWDGSLSKKGVPTIIGSNCDWWDVDDTCDFNTQTNLWSCPWHFQPWGIGNNMTTVANRTIVFIPLYIPGLIDGCDYARFPSKRNCTDDLASYTVGRVSHWGRPVTEKYLAMSPWKGVAGMSNMGWYWRTVSNAYGIDGAPSLFKLRDNMQMAPGSFVLLAIAYPEAAQFTVQLDLDGSFFPNIPMANSFADILSPYETLVSPDKYVCGTSYKSMCTYTGGTGFQWFFDGTYLYLRVVPFPCYNKNFKSKCWKNYFSAYGAKVWDVLDGFTLTVTASCPGCEVQSVLKGVTYYSVPDIPPPSTFMDTFDAVNRATVPTFRPSVSPSTSVPSRNPTNVPSLRPSKSPTMSPSVAPSKTLKPTRGPTAVPTTRPSSGLPTLAPSA